MKSKPPVAAGTSAQMDTENSRQTHAFFGHTASPGRDRQLSVQCVGVPKGKSAFVEVLTARQISMQPLITQAAESEAVPT
jgi:hypothetical protein